MKPSSGPRSSPPFFILLDGTLFFCPKYLFFCPNTTGKKLVESEETFLGDLLKNLLILFFVFFEKTTR